MLTGKVVEREGRLYVACDIPLDATPHVRTLFWRAVSARGTGYGEAPKVGDTATSEIGRPWSTYDPVTFRATGTIDTGRGDVKAEIVETREVPRPKARKGQELRWAWGAWQKSTAKGWVNV